MGRILGQRCGIGHGSDLDAGAGYFRVAQAAVAPEAEQQATVPSVFAKMPAVSPPKARTPVLLTTTGFAP